MIKINYKWFAIIGGYFCSGFGCCFAADLPVIVRSVDPASPVVKAIEAFHGGHPVAAVRIATPIAKQGDPDALFLLGLSTEPKLPYEKSPISSQYQAAAYYYRQAAEAGHPDAYLRSLLYATMGDKDLDDRAKAKASLEAAAEGGDINAIRIIGEGHLRGFFGETPDVKECKKRWTQAAEKGDLGSLYLLAKLHRGDFGFPEEKDPMKVQEFFRKASDLGCEDAFIPLSSILLENRTNEEEGQKVLQRAIAAKKWHAYQLLGEFEKKKGNQDAANNYFLRGAEAGQAECMFEMGYRLLSEKKEIAGLDWIRKSAEVGNAKASLFLGVRFLDGPNPDAHSAYKYLLDAAEEGLWQAQYRLALLYLDGQLGRNDPATAVAWLTQAMTKGDSEVRFKLATLHEFGIGTPVNYANAGVLYELTFKNGHAGAAGRMAHLLNEGLGTDRNPSLAWAYATIGAERGDPEAKQFLSKLETTLGDAERLKAKEALSMLRR